MNYFFDAGHTRWLLWAEMFECLNKQAMLSHMEPTETEEPSPCYEATWSARSLGSSLYYASLLGFTETVQYLHSQGADLNAEDGKFGSALNAAVAGNHESVINYLIGHGASLEPHTKHYSAVWVAASYWECRSMLPNKRSPFRSQVDGAGKDRKVIKILIDTGADLGYKSHGGGRTVLHLVAAIGDVDTIALLLDRGAEIDIRDKYGNTPLRWALRSGHPENAEFLLRRGADINGTSDGGESILIDACQEGYGTVVDLILKGGVDVRGRFRGRQSLHWAAVSAQRSTTKADSTSVITTLIHHGANADEVEDATGRTSLSLAAALGRSANVADLCATQADPDIQDIFGQTALHLAVIGRHPYIVELLLSHGASPRIYDQYGRAPIRWAHEDQHMQELLQSHACGPAYEDFNKERETLRDYIITVLHDIKSCRGAGCHAWNKLGKLLQYANDHEEACTAYEQSMEVKYFKSEFCEDTVCRCCRQRILTPGKYRVCCRCTNVTVCADYCFQDFNNGHIYPPCQGHEFMEIPSEWWSLYLEGKVNIRGETLTEWLERLRDTYARENGTWSYR